MSENPQAVMRFADDEILAELVKLLPIISVRVRVGSGPVCTYVHYLAVELIRSALVQGFTIDRTNGDGPLAEWDGWLVIEALEAMTFLEIAKPGGGALES